MCHMACDRHWRMLVLACRRIGLRMLVVCRDDFGSAPSALRRIRAKARGDSPFSLAGPARLTGGARPLSSLGLVAFWLRRRANGSLGATRVAVGALVHCVRKGVRWRRGSAIADARSFALLLAPSESLRKVAAMELGCCQRLAFGAIHVRCSPSEPPHPCTLSSRCRTGEHSFLTGLLVGGLGI